MGGLSPISSAAAANQVQVLPPALQTGAQTSAFGGIQNLGAFTHPYQANQLTQTQAFNPFAPQAQAGATTAAQFGGQAATNQFNLGGNLEQLGSNVAKEGQQLIPAAQKVFQTAFDPQLQQYQQYLQNVQQQQNAQMALSGVGATPYAAGLNSQQLQQFNIAWQAQQLANQVQGLNAMTGAYQTTGALAQTGAGISGAGAQLQAGAPQLAMQSAMYPYATSEMFASTGMNALNQLQGYGTQVPQQQIQDFMAMLGLVPSQQQAVTNSALAQNQIQNTGFQQLMQLFTGGGAGAGALLSGLQGTGSLGFLGNLATPALKGAGF